MSQAKQPQITTINVSDYSGDETLSGVTWEDFYPGTSQAIFYIHIGCVIISIFGCFGNVFTMMIISKWSNISSGAAFIWGLALTDLVAVFIDGILEILLQMFGIVIASLNSFVCAAFNFLSWVTTMWSFYITVLFSLDKCFAVLFPFKGYFLFITLNHI
ncbi:uncharacterized protein LOC142341374 [Convolutriloba macropyga]|uniref:uncharacterized protein LOC142341374 n=1 Tax=Convolutriloba macropyga TaxID=536237 RepID=UPI003F52684B